MIEKTVRKGISINRTDGHIETQYQLSHLSIKKSFDRLIYQSINMRNRWQKGADGIKEEKHHQDRKEDNRQDGRARRNTIPSINIAVIWLKQKISDNRNKENRYRGRKDQLIGESDASTIQAVA